MCKNFTKIKFPRPFVSVITFYLLYITSKNVCDGALSQSIELFSGPFSDKNICQKNSSKIGLTKMKVPNIQNLQPFVNGNVSEINQYSPTGVWAFYSGENYSMTYWTSLMAPGGSGVCYAHECTDPENCYAKSFRYLGNPDYHLPGLSLLAGNGKFGMYTGDELYFEHSTENIIPAFCASYWVTTGKQNWTIYSGPNFTGDSACIGPFFDPKDAGYGWGQLSYLYVRSVRSGGCFSSNVLSPEENVSKSKDGQLMSRFDGSSLPSRHLSHNDNKAWDGCLSEWQTTTSTQSTSTTTAKTTTKPGGGTASSIQGQFWTILIISLISTPAVFAQNI